MTIDKIFSIIGAGFAFAGIMALAICLIAAGGTGEGMLLGILLFIVFFGVGAVMLYVVFRHHRTERKAREQGEHFRGKIYALHEDNGILINDKPAVSVEVRYWGKDGKECKIICDTKSAAWNSYPRGKSISFYIYEGKGFLVKDSIGDDELPEEKLLMDDAPFIGENHVHLSAVTCKNCGASNYMVPGFVSKCPYCGTFIDVIQTTEGG